MHIALLLVILLSHLTASYGFWRGIPRGKIPNTSDFAVISLILYYDLGLILEQFGYPYQSIYFSSLFAAGDGTFLLAAAVLALAPWLFHAGSLLTNRHVGQQPQQPTSRIAPTKRRSFYLTATLIAGGLALYGVAQFLSGAPIWTLRANLSQSWGPLIVVLYLPMHILAFYVRQEDAHRIWGTLFALGLVGATLLSTAAIGERTLLLAPFLILVLFRLRLTFSKIVLSAAVLLVLAAALLPLFKLEYTSGRQGVDSLIADTISNDVARAGVLRTALEASEPIGTRVMPYPMAGYVYSALFFVPRQLAAFKGGPTAQYFTGYVIGANPEDVGTWGFGVGVIEEVLVNAGIVLVIPGLLVYGMAMGLLDRASLRISSLVVPTRLAAIWLCGYNLPAILLLFGMMAVVGVGLHLVFGERYALRLLPEPLRSADSAGAIS
ncbi:MAG: hypothetical protein M3021_09735 [Actinomycetota bacterium]|nr:hypothetical protein [Actinomycetota bacterium]